MIDIISFCCNGNHYVYDIPGGNLLKCNDVQLAILNCQDLNSKNIVKKLSNQFSTREIIENLASIKKMLDHQLISEKHDTDNGIIFDYSNLISLKTIYYEKKTEEVIKSFELLKKKYFMDRLCLNEKKELNILKIERKHKLSQDLLEEVNYFLTGWEHKCQFGVTDVWLTEYRDAVKNLESSLETITNIMKMKERMTDLPALVKFMKYIIGREKIQFPCKAGLESLYINQSGDVFICENGIQVKDFNKSSYASFLTSVYEEQPCCNCFARFLCGGYCKNKSSRVSVMCSAFTETVLLLLKCCAMLMENDNKYEQFLLDLE